MADELRTTMKMLISPERLAEKIQSDPDLDVEAGLPQTTQEPVYRTWETEHGVRLDYPASPPPRSPHHVRYDIDTGDCRLFFDDGREWDGSAKGLWP